MARYSPTERIGINAVDNIVLNELKWIFREQPISDMGIDAHIELVDNEPTGKLIALQIKTGAGNFHENKDDFVYYGSLEHLEYWTGHSLPVVLVAHIPEKDLTCWVQVVETTAVRTEKAWKIGIPKMQVFDASAKPALTKLFSGTPRDQALRELSIHESLMRTIAAGNKVSVELEDWVNKSLGRTSVELFVDDEPANETPEGLAWQFWYTGYDIKEVAEKLFPWASVRVDEDFYDEHDEFKPTERDLLLMAMDEDNGIPPREADAEEVRPYMNAAGEIDVYRLELRLNEVGESWLVIADYLADQK